MDIITMIVGWINEVLWSYVLIYSLVGVGIFFTLYLGFPQILRFGEALKVTFGGLFRKREQKAEGDAGTSPFQALSVAIAAQVGTGNVAGVATAIASGGPGAIFWMWVSAIFGMSTIFGEAVLAQKYREMKDGVFIGGPAFYISKGIGGKIGKFLAAFFAVAIILALGFVGNMTQANSISGAINKAFAIPVLPVGIALALVAGLIFIGGIKRIANFAQLVVPFMAILYILAGIAVLYVFRAEILPTFRLIFGAAFRVQALGGAFAGLAMKQAVRFGIARGLFSNEAGMGSTPHAHATAKVSHPAKQGLTAMIGVFIDTFIICTFTALIILVTGAYGIEGAKGAVVTQEAFGAAFGQWGHNLLAICLTFFAFTTIVGWYYFAESNVKYLLGDKVLRIFQLLVMVCIVLGSAMKVDFVWDLTDMFNGIMVLPNIVALIFLSKQVKEIYRHYLHCKETGVMHYEDMIQ